MSKKTTTGPRKSLLAGASVLAAAAALAGTPAFAQDNSNTNASSGDDEAIVVTGTRLVRQDFEAISPVTTVAITPETWIISASRYDAHGASTTAAIMR